MLLKKIISTLAFIIFSGQVYADNWRPNQVGAFLSSKIARSIADIQWVVLWGMSGSTPGISS